MRYRPLLVDGEADQIKGITDAIAELSALGGGDILVFLSGEREIRDTAEAINGLQLRFTEVLPLYARLSAAEQHRVFQAHPGRRVVLATNVAETSLTVPGIRYVIDAGTARISRYSARTKVQRLPIEPISQASANQRAGRCGRVAPGVAIRLYDEEDFLGRPEFTEPEVLRTNLAAVILQMAAADLGDISSFPFVEAPDRTQITDGIRLLEELGALKGSDRDHPRLSGIGRKLAAIPVDPRMGRMLLAAERQGCLREMLVIVSGLSIQDPRERPAELREKADQLHRRFWAPVGESGESPPAGSDDVAADGDFMAILRLWEYVRDAQHRLSGNAFRRLCRDEFLHFLRIREWQDLHAQLRDITRDLGLNRNTEPAAAERVHTAALAGLLSHVGLADLREEKPKPGTRPTKGRRRAPIREYLGARGTRFAINPGSSLARVQPPLVVAAEVVETTRLWARTVAEVRAEQVEEVGRPPAETDVLRTALVVPLGLGAGVRAGDVVRRPDRRRPPGRLRPDQPGRGSGHLHPQRARRGRLADPAPVLRAERGGPCRGRAAGGEGAAARPDGRRRGDLRLLRRPDPGRGDRWGAVRQLVEDRPPGHP